MIVSILKLIFQNLTVGNRTVIPARLSNSNIGVKVNITSSTVFKTARSSKWSFDDEVIFSALQSLNYLKYWLVDRNIKNLATLIGKHIIFGTKAIIAKCVRIVEKVILDAGSRVVDGITTYMVCWGFTAVLNT